MFPLLFLMFTLVPILELYLLFQASSSWGFFNTFSVVVGTGILGAYLAKREGREILIRLQEKMSQGGLPANEVIQGALIFAGGLLLLTPGFITDILGFSFVFPVSRLFWLALAKVIIAQKIKRGTVKVYTNYSRSYTDSSSNPQRDFSSQREIKDINE